MSLALTPAELFERAKAAVPGIEQDDFLPQLYAHLRSGRLVASAYNCVIEQGDANGDLGALRYVPRTHDDVQRQDIPAEKWAELAVHMESATAQVWGQGDQSPVWTRDGGDGDPVWGGGYFDGAPVYAELLVRDIQGQFKRLFTAPCNGENEVADVEGKAAAIIAAEIERRGYISQNGAAEIVRKELPDFPRDRARNIAKSMTGNQKRGPRGPRNNCAE